MNTLLVNEKGSANPEVRYLNVYQRGALLGSSYPTADDAREARNTGNGGLLISITRSSSGDFHIETVEIYP